MFTSRLPRSVKIGKRKFTVIKEAFDDEKCGGEFDDFDSTIVISTALDHYNRRRVLMHEILHAAWVEGGLSVGPRKLNEYEERIIRGLDEVLVDVIQRNPKTIRYLQEHNVKG